MYNGTVMFVDDDAVVLAAIRKELRKEPYELLFASEPRTALEILKTRKGAVDVIISDYDMPEMNGLDFLKEVRSQYPATIRVFLTGQGDFQMALRAINEGQVFRFITKPWGEQEIRLTLLSLFQFIEVVRENKLLQHELHKQRELLDKLESEHPGITNVKMDDTGTFVVLDLDEHDS